MIRFFIGLHQPNHAAHFGRCCISINRLRTRRKPVPGREVLLDSGAFTEISRHGGYRSTVAEYAGHIRRLAGIMSIAAAVAQDYMCEAWILSRTGLTIADHQRLTIDRYDQLAAESLPVPIMPVLQGYEPGDYVRHLRAYGDRIGAGRWVGVGSVCKRNGSPADVLQILAAVAGERPDIRLHGFGLKSTALLDPSIRRLLYSADSMAWSFAARREKRNQNDWREAAAFERRILAVTGERAAAWQPTLPFWGAA